MTTIDGSSAQGEAPAWDDDLWDVLLARIARDQMIPILGPALSMVEIDGRRMPLDRYVAEQLAARLDIAASELPPGFGLGAVVSEQARRRGSAYLHPKVNAILREVTFEPPPALVKLASIPNFRMFVTTAYDTLLEAAIDKARGRGGRAAVSIGYSPTGEVYPPNHESNRPPNPTEVHHILGFASALPDFVISDEDLLESLVTLQSDLKRPAKLFDDLSSHNLLVLGGQFPDWLVRLFLRIAKRRRLSEAPRESPQVVADDHSHMDANLVSFLSSFSPSTVVVPGGAERFVDELWRRWSEQYGAPAQLAERGPAIFLSYAREDSEAAQMLFRGLQAQGFSVWFDKSQLQGGDNFDYQIREAIKGSAVFMPVVSRNTESDLRDAYFRLEWNIADEIDKRNSESVRFIMPVVVDNLPRDELREVPANFMRKHILLVDGGVPTSELVAALKSAMEGRR